MLIRRWALLCWIGLTTLCTLPGYAQSTVTVRPADLKTIQGVLKSNRGRVVLVYFWATWCSPCEDELPDLVSLQTKYWARGLQVVGITTDRTTALQEKVLPFMARLHLNFPNYIEANDHGALVRFFSPTWVGQPPSAFIYARNGSLVHELHGRQSLSDYRTVLTTLL